MFDCGEKVVYPGHGVAVVEEVIEKTVGGNKINFLKLTFLFKDMTILVPTYNIDSIGIRKPCTKKIACESIDELSKKPIKKLVSIDFTPSGWNRRNKDYQHKIQSGLLVEIIKIYRDLMYISQQKELSFGERTLLQSTEDLIVQELQIVYDSSKESAIQQIRTPFKQFVYHGEKGYSPEAASSAP